MRNPWDRLLSAYHFLMQGGMNDDDRAWANGHLAHYRSFEQFVHEWVNDANIRSWVHFRPQVDFIVDAGGRMAMDYIGRLEQIGTDFEPVCRTLGISTSLPVLNRMEKGALPHGLHERDD